jgi:translation initiation factor IF-2
MEQMGRPGEELREIQGERGDERFMVEDKNKVVIIPEFLTVRQLATAMDVSPIDIIKELMNAGLMVNINQQIDFDTAAIVAHEMGFEAQPETPLQVEEAEGGEAAAPVKQQFIADEAPEDLVSRPPVVTILGHVDHGKTKLLDAIQHTKVADSEAGGITQHIGAYRIAYQGKQITFLDTPGHEAFTAMRARGAQGADIAVLVVAADSGVQPQTKEAIAHARAARVPIIVALNKIDKPNANPDLVKQQLADVGLTVDEWGGEVICVPVSAKYKTNIEDLLENILLVSEVADLRANPNRPAVGTVVEGRLDTSKGPMATILVQNGTLRVGDAVVIGEIYGRVRAMFDDKGERVREAPPSMPVVIFGLSEVPTAGDILEVTQNERTARMIASRRAAERQEAAGRPTKAFTLDDLYDQFQAGQVKELNLIVKADVQGSIEPIVNSLQKLGDEALQVNILHQATGRINESDIMLAVASRAIVIGFNVTVDPAARRMAESAGVDVRVYDVIYRLIDDVDKALKGLLEPVYEDVITGHAEVRAIFRIPHMGKVAGVYVVDGEIARNALAKVRRGDEVICDGRITSLKRFTEDVKEVKAGFECGVGLENREDFEEGDIIETYRKERVS